MNTGQNRAGPRKRGRPRKIDSSPAASREEERELLPTSVHRNGSGEVGQTPSGTKSADSAGEPPLQPLCDGHCRPGEVEPELQDYLINMKEVTRRTSMCRSTVEYMMEFSDFPLPIKAGVKIVRWWSGEVNQWMRSRPRAKGDFGKRHSRIMDAPQQNRNLPSG